MRLTLLCVPLALAAGVFLGRATADSESTAGSGRVFTARTGDVVRAPAAATRCVASHEARAPNLFCSRIPRGRHQVVFYKDSVFVWRIGDPDRPAFVARWKP